MLIANVHTNEKTSSCFMLVDAHVFTMAIFIAFKCTCTYALAIDIWQLDGIFFGFTILIVTTQVDEQALTIQVDVLVLT